MSSPLPPLGLSLAGFDPSGGAGLLLDTRVLDSLGILPMAVPLAETVQNGLACSRILPPAVDPVLRLESLGPHLGGRWGVKVGLCALERPALRRLLGVLDQLGPSVRIWDPILAPSAGVGCHTPQELQDMAEVLLRSGQWIVCPNRGEAAALAGLPPERIRTASVEALSHPLLDLGARAVWLKGGHADGGTVQDHWITPSGITAFEAVPRLPGDRRGTGCFLSAAWLGLRLQGLDEEAAAREAAALLRAHWSRAGSPGGMGRPCFLPEGA
jgi:hydroxymethylpyrimidine/phosphomethylpyrimidine kinase